MKQNSFLIDILAFVTFVGILAFIGNLLPDNNACKIEGCENERMSSGKYCAYHYYLYNKYNYGTTTGYKSTTRSTSAANTGISSNPKKNTSSNSSSGGKSHNSYDEGYNSVYEDDDYDWDRYYEDDDYADGVDDAMDDEGW